MNNLIFISTDQLCILAGLMVLLIITALVLGFSCFTASARIKELLTENKRLRHRLMRTQEEYYKLTFRVPEIEDV